MSTQGLKVRKESSRGFPCSQKEKDRRGPKLIKDLLKPGSKGNTFPAIMGSCRERRNPASGSPAVSRFLLCSRLLWNLWWKTYLWMTVPATG